MVRLGPAPVEDVLPVAVLFQKTRQQRLLVTAHQIPWVPARIAANAVVIFQRCEKTMIEKGIAAGIERLQPFRADGVNGIFEVELG